MILPSGVPPLKGGSSSTLLRKEFLRAFLSDLEPLQRHAKIHVNSREMDKGDSPSYTYDTLLHMGAKDSAKLVFVFGSDQFLNWNRWSRFPEVIQLANWIVLLRKGNSLSKLKEQIERLASSGIPFQRQLSDHGLPLLHYNPASAQRGWIEFIDTPAPEISSTFIREKIQSGEIASVETLLTPAVYSYLKQSGGYGMQDRHPLKAD